MSDSYNKVLDDLRLHKPVFWRNPNLEPAKTAFKDSAASPELISVAEARWQRLAVLLVVLFPELGKAGGIISSPLLQADKLAGRLLPDNFGRLLIKADHALPVAGSIKARGGIYAVMCHAEKLALENGIISGYDDDYLKLATPEAKAFLSNYELSVGSTGNLGLSIGIAGAALGFKVSVHMSTEAKEWKKERLRKRGVRVVEHQSDYTAACAVARQEADKDPHIFFIDDENSLELFSGYTVAVPELAGQLAAMGIMVDADHPLFLYLPCGVGGAPGGITFAARRVFGDNVHCFTVEPVEAPCMLLGLMTGLHSEANVHDYGLELRTDADGLAVAAPSLFVGQWINTLLDGSVTASDSTLYRHLLDMYECENLEVEPSAAAGCAVPHFFSTSDAAKKYLNDTGLSDKMPQATHIIWTTGGLFVPPEIHEKYRQIAGSNK